MSNYTGDRRRISVRVVDSLKPGSIVWDTVLAGFAVRCQRRDKVYVLKYRAGLRQRWYTIGRHGMPWAPETARREARRLLGDIAAGRDPALLRTVSTTDTTVAALVTKFVNEYTAAKTKPRTAAEYKRLLAKLLPPEFRTRQIVDVTRADIERLHHGLRNTPYQANRVLAVLSRMFALAEGWGLRHDGSNPCRHVQKYRERRRDRFLSAEELARLGIALTAAGKDGEPPAAIAAIRLLALTGCRKSEVLRLRWSQVEPNCLRLSDSKTGAKVVPLGAAARELLASLPSWEGNPYVIVGDRPNSHLLVSRKSGSEFGDKRAWTMSAFTI